MKRIIDDSVWFGIAEAIREKTENTNTYKPTEMAQAISEISGGDNTALIDLIERDITEIAIPDGATIIGNCVFRACLNLSNITISNTVKTIGYGAFMESGLTRIILPDSVTSIEGLAFKNCTSLVEVVIPDSVTLLGGEAFRGSSIVSFTCPKGVTEISSNAFDGCKALQNVTIVHGVTRLAQGCFYGCSSLSTLYLPNTLTSISSNSFANCSSLEFVTLEQGFNCSLNVSASTLYSVETIISWFEALADRTGKTACTLTIGSTNLAKLTDEQKAIATNKNWNLA